MVDKRRDIKIAPPPEGWDVIEYVDGYKAQIVGATTETINGTDWVTFDLRPFDDLAKRYNITLDMLDERRCLQMKYLKSLIITLNEDDPARKLKFSLLNFEGKETYATRWFNGISQIKEIEKLREVLEQYRVENAYLREENLTLKTNMPKFIKQNFSDVAKDLMPLFKEAVLAETQMTAVGRGGREYD